MVSDKLTKNPNLTFFLQIGKESKSVFIWGRKGGVLVNESFDKVSKFDFFHKLTKKSNLKEYGGVGVEGWGAVGRRALGVRGGGVSEGWGMDV